MDVISRQAAIDELNVLCQEHRYRIPGKRETYSEYNEAWQDALDRAEGAICNLPSAQPEHTVTHSCDSERTETHDLVSRRAALEAMDTWDKFGCDPDGKLVRYDDDKHYVPYVRYEDMVYAVKNLPSAQPQRIRGRWEYLDYGGVGNYHCSVCRRICVNKGDYDFCPFCGADMRGGQDGTT